MRGERVADLGFALGVDPVGGAQRVDHAPRFAGDALAQVGDVGLDAGDFGVVFAKPAGHLLAHAFLPREVGLEALDEAVLHHLGHAVGAAGLGLARAAVDLLRLHHGELGGQFGKARGFDVEALVGGDDAA
ncbi:MAG: hypothetical protein KDF24_09800, partial [Rhodocyclaceae bacterium]|nr:hypothetical protein [Rhodocyclaceae bacterium]